MYLSRKNKGGLFLQSALRYSCCVFVLFYFLFNYSVSNSAVLNVFSLTLFVAIIN